MLVLTRGVAAQQLSGKVTDSIHQPLAGVVVSLFRDTALVTYQITDNQGNYSFMQMTTGTRYRLALMHTGYGRIDTSLLFTKDITLSHILSRKIVELKAVAVNSDKPMIEKRADRLVFNVSQSITASRGDAMDVLAVAPLVRVEQDQIAIVGKGGVDVLINDRRVHLSGAELADYLKSIPSTSIERVEIITSPPARYSAAGNAGLLNIVLKKPMKDAWNAGIRSTSTLTTYLTENLGLTFNMQRKKLGLSASLNGNYGSMKFTEEPLINYTDETWSTSSIRRSYAKSLNARVLGDYQVNSKFVLGFQVYASTNAPESNDITNTFISAHGRPDSLLNGGGTTSSQTSSGSVNINGTYKLGKNNDRIQVDIDYFGNNRDNYRGYISNASVPAIQHDLGEVWNSLNTTQNQFGNYSLNIDVAQHAGKTALSYGANAMSSRNINSLQALGIKDKTNTVIDDNDKFSFTEQTLALFADADRELGRFEIKAGLRGEYTFSKGESASLGQVRNNQYFNLFPTFYTTYFFAKEQQFSFSYNRRIERPGYNSLNPFQRYISQNYYSVGNPYLLPWYSNNLELGYNKGNLVVQAFLNSATNGIAQTAIPIPATKMVVDTAQNFYDAINAGISGSWFIKPVSWWECRNDVSGYYVGINQYRPDLVANSNSLTWYIRTDNTFKLNSQVYWNLSFFYYSPEVMGIFYRSSRYSLGTGWRYRPSSSWEISLFASDILRTAQSTLKANVNGVAEYYKNYYDNRNLRLVLYYKLGNAKINTKQRGLANDTEKQRAN